MNLSEKVINETLTEVVNSGLPEVTKENIIKILTDSSVDERNNKIIEKALFFMQFPLIREIYNNDKFLDNLLGAYICSVSTEGEILCYSKLDLQSVTLMSKYLDLKLFFSHPKVIEFVKSDVRNILYFSDIPNFLDYFEDEIRNNFVEKILKNINATNFYLLDDLSDFMLEELINSFDDEKKEVFYNAVVKEIFQIKNSFLANKIWELYKDRILKWSLKDRIDFFKKVSDKDLKKKMFDEMDFISNLTILADSFKYELSDKITDYVSEDILLTKCIQLIHVNKYQDILMILSPEKQIEVVKALDAYGIKFWFYSACLKEETIKYVFDVNPEIISERELYNLYKKFKDVKYLIEIKNRGIKSYIFDLSILCEDEFVKLLSEEEKEQVAANIQADGSGFIIYSEIVTFNDYFYKIYLNKHIDFLSNNPEKEVFFNISNINKGLTLQQQLVILKHMKYTDILREALWNTEIFEYIKEILKSNPDLLNQSLFDDKSITSNLFEKEIQRVEFFIKYLNDDRLQVFFNKSVIESNESMKSKFRETILSKPNLFQSIELIEYFSEEERIYIFYNMSIEKLLSFFREDSTKYLNYLTSELYNRFDKVIDYLNSSRFFNRNTQFMYSIMDDTHRIQFIDKLTNIELLNAIIISCDIASKTVLDRLLRLYESEILLQVSERKNDVLPIAKYSEDNKKYIISNIDFNVLVYMCANHPENDIINEFILRITKNPNILINEYVVKYILKINIFLPQEYRIFIVNFLMKKLDENINFFDKYKYKLILSNVDDLIIFLLLIEEECIQNNTELFDKLVKENPYILKTIRPIMFNEDIKTMDFHFISKTSKYIGVQEGLKNLSLDSNKLKFLNMASKYLLEKCNNEFVYDRLISEIIEYLSHSKTKLRDFDFSTVNDSNLKDLITFILYDYTTIKIIFLISKSEDKYETINDMVDFEVDGFIENRKLKCDEVFATLTDIDDMKNIYFNKYLSMSLMEAKNFYQTYVVNYDKVMKYAKSDLPLKFIELITMILNINDVNTLKELYYKNNIYFDISELYEIEGIMSQAYYDSLAEDYQNKQNGTLVSKTFKDKDGNDITLEMTELVDDFGLLVHSTCAYGNMPLIGDNYYTAWNYNSNTENHGICTSYITNSSYGTAAVTDTGVMFGFTKINNKSIAAYSPYDLATRNHGYNISCSYIPFYTTLDQIPDYTRHTHNEFDLERRNVDIDSTHFCIQPDAIVIFEDMDDSIKANSIKAYQDFKENGVELKLIYIDRVKIAKNEANKLSNMIKEYYNNHDLNLLKEIINKYESNICGCDFLAIGNEKSKNLFDMDELFMTDTIIRLLYETLDSIESKKDITSYNNFVSIINEEQYKFDLIDDKNPDRKHIFKLNDDKLKERIREVGESISDDEKVNTNLI